MRKIFGQLDRTSTPGERRFYARMAAILQDDPSWLCYYEPWLGNGHPDFLLLHPEIGVILVEIKDYLENHVVAPNQTGNWALLQGETTGAVGNPFDQLNKYYKTAQARVDHCQFPPYISVSILLVAAFSNIREESVKGREILQVAPNTIRIAFVKNLHSKKTLGDFLAGLPRMDALLNPPHFQVLRANFVPSARLAQLTQKKLADYYRYDDQVKMLDYEQEELAKRLGEGHRLFFGVAGSGKTVLLIARARYLKEQHPDWRILVLCYNRLLSQWITQLLVPLDFTPPIIVATFHKWAKDHVEAAGGDFSIRYRQANETAERLGTKTAFFEKIVPQILADVLDHSLPPPYNAILIDEAQDFTPEWLRLVVRCLDPVTNSLLIACDGLQGIYARNRFHWSDAGIAAKGRVVRLTRSYRNPAEIGQCAAQVLPANLLALMGTSDEFLSTNEFSGGAGSVELFIAANRTEEYHCIVGSIQRDLAQYKPILVLFQQNLAHRRDAHPLFGLLANLGISYTLLRNYHLHGSAVLIGTTFGTKGLEASAVYLPEIDGYETPDQLQLLYVGMTRATHKLVLSASRVTDLVDKLRHMPVVVESKVAAPPPR